MIEINNKTRTKIDTQFVKKIAECFLREYKIKNKTISIAFVGDAVIRRLNNQYRKKNKVTDVLSFVGEGNELGEILIDYAQIKRQAPKYSRSIKAELTFILVHGLLHLLGYNDEKEKDRLEMVELGKDFIKKTQGHKTQETKKSQIANNK